MVVLEKLIEDLEHPDSEIRFKTVEAIKETEESGVNISLAMPLLLKTLCDEDKKVRWAAVDVVTAYNTKSDPYRYKESLHIIEELTSDDIQKKVQFTDMLRITTEYDMIRDRDERNIEHAIPALAASLFDENLEVRNGALGAIAAALHNDQDIFDALPAIIKTLSSDDENLRKSTSITIRDAAMKNHDISEYIPILTQYLSDDFEPVKWGAADTLTYYYVINENWDEVRSLLSRSDKDIRQEAAGTLAQIYPPKISPIIPDLKKLLSDESEDVQLVAVKTLLKTFKKIKEITTLIPIIVKSLENEKDENRIYVARIINDIINFISGLQNEDKNKIRSPNDLWYPITQIISDLERTLSDKNEKVKNIIAIGLAKYYLRINQPEDIIRILGNFDKKTQDEILKSLEYDEWEKPPTLISYIIEKDNPQLLKKIDEAIKNRATELNLSGSSLDKRKLLDLPPEIGNITTLTRLDLGYNNFTYIPKEIGNLINLITLILSQNKLTSLPPEIGELKNLDSLYLYRNQLTTLPKEIGNLPKLRYLQLIDNQLNFLPDEFGNLKSLINLELKGNQLTFLPNTFGNLINLRWLDLRENNIAELPEEMKELQNLESISLGDNKMTYFPKIIFNLKNLKTLNFNNNNLTSLPKEIGNLKQLETLELRKNKLTALPKEIGKLPKLRYLDLMDNQLTSLPEEILNLRSLHYLEIGRNKLDIPEDIISYKKKPSKIFASYFKNKT